MASDGPQDLNSLLQRLRANDSLAANALLECCQDLRALAAKIFHDFPQLRGLEDPSDVLQEAEVRLLRGLKKMTPDTVDDFFRIAAWEIRCVLRNLVCHHFGPQGAASRQFAGGGQTDEAGARPARMELDATDSGDNPLDLCSWTELHDLLQSLPARERSVVDLLWYCEMDQEKAAKELHCSVATVKRRWHAARRRLATFLHGE